MSCCTASGCWTGRSPKSLLLNWLWTRRHQADVRCNASCALILMSIFAQVQVATPRDPASARLGESLYTFLPRSVVGNLRDGVVMELDRLRARHLPFFCLQNRCRTFSGTKACRCTSSAWHGEWGVGSDSSYGRTTPSRVWCAVLD